MWAATIPMASCWAAGQPCITRVKASIAHGRNSMGIRITKKDAFVPRLSWANVYTKARIKATPG